MPDEQEVSPKEFLRARRPERFSDSVVVEESGLTRPLLEHHLDSLTSRSQQFDFENFCREIVKREICPNLLPQTGPTGGGDSKVDSETYPVAEELTFTWRIGEPEAASERWAFAFSAAEDWQQKMEDDIEKIEYTERGYSRAYFITNQFVKDRKRAQIEDELSDKHGLDVRILDLNWLCDKVFDGGHEKIAADELDLDVPFEEEVKEGPRDVERKSSLEEIEANIREAVEKGRVGRETVNDAITAAKLSRRLELPRTEIEGRLDRAQRLAQKYGSPHQLVDALYERAWTAFWWFEDCQLLVELYEEVEQRVRGTRRVYELELLTNLWHLLTTVADQELTGSKGLDLAARTEILEEELERLRNEEGRPSSALHARTLLLLIELRRSIEDDTEEVETVLFDLQEVVQESEGLVGYPLDPLVEIVTDLGNVLGDVPAYDKLFEMIVEATSVREKEITSARMLVKRGNQQLDADNPYEAIRLCGRALMRLYRHESRHDLVRALYFCARAYERVGLMWAARGTLLTGASVATDDLWRYDSITLLQVVCVKRLKWVELQLGRVPHSLAWYEIEKVLQPTLLERGYDEELIYDDNEQFDRVLAILFLKTEVWDLKWLKELPDVLSKMGLHASSIALLYALGHEKEFQSESGPNSESEEERYQTFLLWRDQPASDDLPSEPGFYVQRNVDMRSTVLGCEVKLTSENDLGCFYLSESILAALESFLATGMVQDMMAGEPSATITVQSAKFTERPFTFEMKDMDGRPHVEVRWSGIDVDQLSMETQQAIRSKLLELIAGLAARILIFKNPDSLLEELIEGERALDRSLNFTTSFATTENILGQEPKFSISDWTDGDTRTYNLQRSKPWDAEDQDEEEGKASKQEKPLTPGEGEPPEEMPEFDQAKHTDIEVQSLIRHSLWDKASWGGTAFLVALDEPHPSYLALIFENGEAGKKIFNLWRQSIGTIDDENYLRVSIVQGFNKKRPNDYRVLIGSNPKKNRSGPRFSSFIYRIHEMESTSPKKLNLFIEDYQDFGKYILIPATADSVGYNMNPDFFPQLGIGKVDLNFRKAWKIGLNDIDGAAIKKEDDPVIPPHVSDAPIRELLARKRSQS